MVPRRRLTKVVGARALRSKEEIGGDQGKEHKDPPTRWKISENFTEDVSRADDEPQRKGKGLCRNLQPLHEWTLDPQNRLIQ